LILILLLAGSTAASASSILDGWAFNIDGVFTPYDPAGSDVSNFPPQVNGSGFDAGVINLPLGLTTGSGTGTIVATVNGPGEHTVITWLDVHLDLYEPWYTDEMGRTAGSLPTGATWQIDEPGWGACDSNTQPADCPTYTGTAIADVAGGTLSNSNRVPIVDGDRLLTDISLALGRTFTVASGQLAHVTFRTGYVSSTEELNLYIQNNPGFYLVQESSHGPDAYWMTSEVTYEATPEPKAWHLMLSGALAIAFGKMRTRRNSRG
jgi:hypothetical protein